VLFSNPFSVAWLTGFAPPTQVGPSPFAGGLPLVWREITMQNTRRFLNQLGLPPGDAYDLPTSAKRFPDGAQYRVEIPSVEGPRARAPGRHRARHVAPVLSRGQNLVARRERFGDSARLRDERL
jgi:hypothetical protein